MLWTAPVCKQFFNTFTWKYAFILKEVIKQAMRYKIEVCEVGKIKIKLFWRTYINMSDNRGSHRMRGHGKFH